MVLRKTTAKALALAITVLAAGCGSGSGPVTGTGATRPAPAGTAALTPVRSGVVEIAYRGYVIEPAAIVVRSGQEIRWTNHDVTRHNVVVKPDQPQTFTSNDFDEGGTATYAPKRPGVYAYLCTFHPASMQGTITVQR